MTKQLGLTPCLNPFNCVFIVKECVNVNAVFSDLVQIAEDLPRTHVLEKNDDYWKGVCRSLIFRFPDDLEILKINSSSKGVIQIKSASRFGGGDLGVNSRRVNYLLHKIDFI